MKTKHKANNNKSNKIQQTKNLSSSSEKIHLAKCEDLEFHNARNAKSKVCEVHKGEKLKVVILKLEEQNLQCSSPKCKDWSSKLKTTFPKKTQKPQINKLKTQDSKLPLPKTHKP